MPDGLWDFGHKMKQSAAAVHVSNGFYHEIDDNDVDAEQ